MNRFLLILATLAGLLSPAYAAGLYPLSNYQQFDANGRLMAGARLYLYDGGTSTPRTGYKDLALTSAHPNPIVADASGRIPLIYLADGYYRHRLTNSTGTMVFDQDGLPVLTTSAGGAGTSVDPDSVFKSRDVKIRFDDQPLAGYVRLNGRTIGSSASGATERANADTEALYTELWAYSTITVAAGKGASAAADFAANKPLTLPDASGRGIFGMDDLGAGARSVLTSATITGPTLPGSTGGAQTLTIAQANLPSYSLTGGSGNVSVTGTSNPESADHSHTFSGTTTTNNVGHTHGGVVLSGNTGPVNGTGSNAFPVLTLNTGSTAGESTSHTHDYSGSTSGMSASHNHTFTGTGTASSITISSGGSGTAASKLPPVLLLMIYIRL